MTLKQTSKDPSICVLIPVFNENVVIEHTISSLLEAGIGCRDIYVVDDKSTDNTATIAKSKGVNVYTVPENGGKAIAQSRALRYFRLTDRYEWVVFLDGDTKVDINFLKAMRQAATDDPTVGLYVGQVKSAHNNHTFSALRAVEYAYGQDIAKQGQSNFNVIFVSPGCASMYRCDIIPSLHIDHKTLAEDMDLTMQVHRRGYRVKYVPTAVVHTQDPSTLQDYNKQMLRWFRGFWQVVLKHRVFSFTRKQRVDFYIWLLVVDSTVFNRLFWLMGLTSYFPERWWQIWLADMVTMLIVSCYGALRTKRMDVLGRFPATYIVGFVAVYLYIRAFIEIIVLRKEILTWNKVKRYDFTSNQIV